MIRGVMVDLDDTLYPQSTWLTGAWEAVANAAPSTVDRTQLLMALATTAAAGSDRGHIIDRAMDAIGAPAVDVAPLVEAFRSHAPRCLRLYPGAMAVITQLRRSVPVALVTDGDPTVQAAKLSALGLASAFDTVVMSDAIGREHRKPDPLPFRVAAERMSVPIDACVMVGDRPDKDTRGAREAGMLGAVRVRTGEYSSRADEDGCLAVVDSIAEAGAWLLGALGRRAQCLARTL